jgi:hypothetical protein
MRKTIEYETYARTIRVESCLKCPYRFVYKCCLGMGRTKIECTKLGKQINIVKTFPKCCPLEKEKN